MHYNYLLAEENPFHTWFNIFDNRTHPKNWVKIITNLTFFPTESWEDNVGHRFVKMHDLIRDTALKITRERHPRFMVKAGVGLMEIPVEQEWTEDMDKFSLMMNNINEIPCVHLQGVRVFQLWFWNIIGLQIHSLSTCMHFSFLICPGIEILRSCQIPYWTWRISLHCCLDSERTSHTCLHWESLMHCGSWTLVGHVLKYLSRCSVNPRMSGEVTKWDNR